MSSTQTIDSRPRIESAIAEGFTEVGGRDAGGGTEVRDGPCDLEHPIVRARGELQRGDGIAQEGTRAAIALRARTAVRSTCPGAVAAPHGRGPRAPARGGTGRRAARRATPRATGRAFR